MAYRGIYINLDTSPERRAAMEAQLGRLGLAERYRRFAAVDGRGCGFPAGKISARELGCFVSHWRVLQENLDADAHLHVLEDDTVLARCCATAMADIVGSGPMEEHDLLFTDMAVPIDFKFCREARIRFARQIAAGAEGKLVVRFNLFPFISCMNSYLVNRRSIPLVAGLLREELERGPAEAVDLFIRAQVAAGRLRAKCLFPFITTVLPGTFPSTLEHADVDRVSDLAVGLLRYSFFVDCDRRQTQALAEQKLGGRDDFHGRLLSALFGYMTSKAFRQP